MTRRTFSAVAALTLAALTVACDGLTRSPTVPAPTPGSPLAPAPTTPLVGGTLSGVVFESTPAGRMVVAGVEVYCDACGPVGHTASITDAEGAYRLEGAPGGTTRLLVAKAGYALARPNAPPPGGGWIGGIDAVISGDTRLDIEIIRQ